MTIDPIHRPSLARNDAAVLSRLAELERVARTIVRSVDAGGVDWTSGNAAWIAPTSVVEWTELRLSNSLAGGSQVWRAVSNGTVNVWKLVV